ncbi:MAG: IS5 family transposase [Candidatus Nanoarchaeia archaeon]
MDVIQFKFKKFSKIVDNLCHSAQIPKFFRYVQKKTYTNHQFIFLLVAKEHSNLDYRGFVESLYDSKIPKYIGLKRIPHFTTLQKFAKRIATKLVDKLVFKTKNLFKEKGRILGADSTGMELDHASSHYCKRIDRVKPVKGFVNLNMICDVKNKNILVTKIRKRRRHDCSDFMPMFNKIKHLDFDFFVADKGYDSTKNHKAIYDSGAESQIKVKDYGKTRFRAGQAIRKRARREHNIEIYGQRSITESVFSALKRKYGARLRARQYKTQKIELLCKVLAYNIERAIRIANWLMKYLKAFLQSLLKRKIYIYICKYYNKLI